MSGTLLIFLFPLPDPEHSATARGILVLGYALAAWFWWRASRRKQNAADSFWWRLGAVLLVLLTINKVLDLRQVSEAGLRALAKAGGWYEHRRPAQFVVAIVLPSVLAILTAIFLKAKGTAFFHRHLLATAGWVLLLTYLVLRQILEWKPALAWMENLGYFEWRLMLEAGGVAMVILSALIARPRQFP